MTQSEILSAIIFLFNIAIFCFLISYNNNSYRMYICIHEIESHIFAISNINEIFGGLERKLRCTY